MSTLEQETKLTVSETDHGILRREGSLLEERDQLNIYLHDPARVADVEGYFRVRFETGREPVATLKIPREWTGEMRTMVEVEGPLAEMGPELYPRPRRWIRVQAPIPAEFRARLQGMGIAKLRRLGWMRNHRSVLQLSDLGTIELDRTSLPGGGVHYEVEIENPLAQAHSALVDEVRGLVPSARFSRVGKFSRFLAAQGLDRPG